MKDLGKKKVKYVFGLSNFSKICN